MSAGHSYSFVEGSLAERHSMVDVPRLPSPYRIVRCLSRGSSEHTFLGIDETTLRNVVIARPSQQCAAPADPRSVERWCQLLTRFDHPLLPRVIDSFEHENAIYLVTQFIEGADLSTLQRRGERFTEAHIIAMLRDLAEIFEYLHHQLLPPIVHRDISPRHVLRSADARYHLLDFWGAACAEVSDEDVGTYGYMSPEAFEAQAGPPADRYALGATVLALTTGTEPEDLPHRGRRIDVRRALQGRLGEPLTALLHSLLEPDPERRARRLLPLLNEIEPGRAAARVAMPTQECEASPEPELASRTGLGAMLVTAVGMISLDRVPGAYEGSDAAVRFFGAALGWLYPACPVIIILVSSHAGRALKRQAARWYQWLSLTACAALALLVFVCAPLAHNQSLARSFVLMTTMVAGMATMGSRCMLFLAVVTLGIVGAIWSSIMALEGLARAILQ
jgi:hypothetical protein